MMATNIKLVKELLNAALLKMCEINNVLNLKLFQVKKKNY